jgi:hypothetical protein
MLVSARDDAIINIWNPNDNYNLVKKLTGHTGSVMSLLQLSNGMLVSASNDKTINIWNPNDNYNLVKTLTGHSSGVNSLLQLSNGMLGSGSDEINIWNPYVNVNVLPSKHSKEINIIKNINETYVMTVSEDMICISEIQNINTTTYKCTDLKQKINDVTKLNSTHYLSSEYNGNLNYWDIDSLSITRSINLSELSDLKESSPTNSTVKALKLFREPYDGILAFLNTHKLMIINEINQIVMFKDDTMCSDLRDIYVSENNFTSVCSTREMRYYEFAPILYINQEIFEYQINFRYSLHPKDQDDKIRIKV